MSWGPGTTEWTRLLVGAGVDARDPWSFFYGRYREAVLALYRREGVHPDELEDLVQAFFTAALQQGFLERADPERGRFRGYLCLAARRFLASELRREGRQKRMPAGGLVALATDLQPVARDPGPEDAFDLAWARGVLERAVSRAREELLRAGKEPHARAWELRRAGSGWREIAARLGSTAAAVRGWGQRFEQRVAEHVRAEVAGTVLGEEELERELADLARILAGAEG